MDDLWREANVRTSETLKAADVGIKASKKRLASASKALRHAVHISCGFLMVDGLEVPEKKGSAGCLEAIC